MSECSKCKERYGCDRLLYDCPRESIPDGLEDELSDSQVWQWESYLQNKWRKRK